MPSFSTTVQGAAPVRLSETVISEPAQIVSSAAEIVPVGRGYIPIVVTLLIFWQQSDNPENAILR